MRLIGPNAMGVVNTDPEVSLHATFATGSALPGRVGFFVQSGALAGTVLQSTTARCLGMSSFVSIGDRADVSGNDLMQYWLEDVRTDVVALHLQGFGNPRKFARIARTLGQVKPVVALKSGRGSRDVAVDAMFRSAGVIRVDTLSQLFATAQLLAVQPLPAGPRVGIVGTSSALAALAVDACAAAGLSVTVNLDLGPLATPEELGRSLRSAAASGDVDALLVLVTPNASSNGEAIRSAVGHVPVIASYLGHDGVHPDLAVLSGDELAGPGSVPSFASPEDAAVALGRAVAYATWRSRPTGSVPALSVTPPDLSELPHDGSWLPDAGVVLSVYGLRPWPIGRAQNASAARDIADSFGWPVALKSPDEAWRHRIDVGAVLLSVPPDQLERAWDELQQLVGPTDLLVQPMAPAGVSTVVRLVQDPSVGPLVSLRLGGVAADLLADPVVRTLPLTDLDAHDLVRSIRGFPLLEGYDVAALEDVLHRVARMGEDLPSVAEVLFDPVLVLRSGVTLLHAGVRLLPPVDNPEGHARHLVRSGGVHLR
jgi:acetyltransferase